MMIKVEIFKIERKFQIVCKSNISETVRLKFKTVEEAKEWIKERNTVSEKKMIVI